MPMATVAIKATERAPIQGQPYRRMRVASKRERGMQTVFSSIYSAEESRLARTER